MLGGEIRHALIWHNVLSIRQAKLMSGTSTPCPPPPLVLEATVRLNYRSGGSAATHNERIGVTVLGSQSWCLCPCRWSIPVVLSTGIADVTEERAEGTRPPEPQPT